MPAVHIGSSNLPDGGRRPVWSPPIRNELLVGDRPQLAQAFVAQLADRDEGVHPCHEERLALEDVPDSCCDPLIEQNLRDQLVLGCGATSIDNGVDVDVVVTQIGSEAICWCRARTRQVRRNFGCAEAQRRPQGGTNYDTQFGCIRQPHARGLCAPRTTHSKMSVQHKSTVELNQEVLADGVDGMNEVTDTGPVAAQLAKPKSFNGLTFEDRADHLGRTTQRVTLGHVAPVRFRRAVEGRGIGQYRAQYRQAFAGVQIWRRTGPLMGATRQRVRQPHDHRPAAG